MKKLSQLDRQVSTQSYQGSNQKKQHNNKVGFLSSLLGGFAISFLVVLISFIVIAAAVAVITLGKIDAFSKKSGLSTDQMASYINTAVSAFNNPIKEPTNLLILGVDSLDTRPNSEPLTDTMLIVSINYRAGKITTLPLPRDLWSADYQTKINALYYYGKQRNPDSPEEFPKQVVSDLTGLTIDHTLVIKMTDLSTLIDLIGGVLVDVPVAFTDEEFPRPDVDVSRVTDPDLLYKTITFREGQQLMDGQRALEYVRSRKSADTEGTDTARSNRQQQVIMAIIDRFSSPYFLFVDDTLAKLIRFYEASFAKQLSIDDAIKISSSLLAKGDMPVFANTNLSIYPDDDNGVITHPSPNLYNGQWVYVIRNREQFEQYIKQNLEIDHDF